MTEPATRKQRGAWFTPDVLIDEMIGWITSELDSIGPPLRVVDPACGDGRLLRAVRDAFPHRQLTLVGCDIDPATAHQAGGDGIDVFAGDALEHDWELGTFDVVIGNPPFLSQLAAETSRGGSSRFGGGPYANSAAEFAMLSIELARPGGGVVALVLPQSVLGARDAAEIRQTIDRTARRAWSWWQPQQDHFDASVNVCMIGWRRSSPKDVASASPWTSVVTDRLGIPALPTDLAVAGTLADHFKVSADFRNQYYGLVPAVDDHSVGPPLITSGLIDVGSCHWGTRPVRFAKRSFEAPRVDIDALEPSLRAWATAKLVPKVLVANQTRVVEAVLDPTGEWIPSVPVISVIPHSNAVPADHAAAVLTSPVASAAVWHLGGGTGLSTSSVRIAPRFLGEIPWPRGPLTDAAAALASGRIVAAGRLVLDAYAVAPAQCDALMDWWVDRLPDHLGDPDTPAG